MRPAIAVPIAYLALALVLGGAWYGVRLARERDGGAYAVAGLEPMTAETATLEGHRVAPALLMVIYDAFGRTEEAEVYDTLAEVAAGEALEALYLERMGAMVGGGLDASDQTIHEMRLLELATRQSGERLAMDARWQVIGIVGHDEHQHVRGNAYAADLTVEPVDGAWRITGFTLSGVDRTLAGTAAEAPTSWW